MKAVHSVYRAVGDVLVILTIDTGVAIAHVPLHCGHMFVFVQWGFFQLGLGRNKIVMNQKMELRVEVSSGSHHRGLHTIITNPHDYAS